jgi:Tfp pilus assembly protein PilF
MQFPTASYSNMVNWLSEKLRLSQIPSHWIFSLIALSFFTLLVFGKNTGYDFLGMDDHIYVWDNPFLANGLTWKGLKFAFTADLTFSSEFADYWQPITFISRMLDISLFGMSSGWHHFINLLFHVANVWLVFFLLQRLTRDSWLSFVVTALFALHPLHTEIMGWVTARKDVLSVFLGLITMHIYFWVRDRPSLGRQIGLAGVFALSLMAKPMMITIPVILVFFDFYKAQQQKNTIDWRLIWQSGLNKWPLWLMIVCYLPIPFLGQPQAFEFAVNHPLAKATCAYAFYMGKLLWPVNLALYGPVPEQPIPHAHVILAGVFLALLGMALIFRKRKAPLMLLGLAWFQSSALPTVGLTWVADRFMYFPMLGFWLMVVSGMFYLFKDKRLAAGIFVPILLFYAWQSFQQIDVWENDKTVMTRALWHDQTNYSAHNILGVVYAREAKDDKALYHLNEAIRLKPERDKPYNNIGLILEKQGKYKEALRYYAKSVELRPDDFRAINNMGIVHVRQGNYAEGIQAFKQALKLNPRARDTRNNLAIAYFRAGDTQTAEKLAHEFKSAMLFNQFGLFCAVDGKYAQAKVYFQKALAIDPDFEEAKRNLQRLKPPATRG